MEASLNLYWSLRWNLNNNSSSNIDKIIIQTEHEGRKSVTVADEIHELILKRMKKILSSGDTSLPAHTNFKEFIGDCGQNDGVDQILNGKNIPQRLFNNTYEELLIKSMDTLENESLPFPLIDGSITAQDFNNMFLNTKECTSSSPSGLHVGHYKVAALYPPLCKILSQMVSLLSQYGFSPERWRKSTHLMLENLEGNPILEKLRIIQLIEDDFNSGLKIKIGKQLMHEAESSVFLGHDMHGGRKNHSAHNAFLTQQLPYNIIQQERRPGVMLNLDASNCFDKIYPNLAVPALVRIGAPRNLCLSLLKKLKHMSHKVLTSHGLSKNQIQQKNGLLWSGVGQGSGLPASSDLPLNSQS